MIAPTATLENKGGKKAGKGGSGKIYTMTGLQVCLTGRRRAYTLTEATSRVPVGSALNMKEDNAMAVRRTITVVESVAVILLTLA